MSHGAISSDVLCKIPPLSSQLHYLARLFSEMSGVEVVQQKLLFSRIEMFIWSLTNQKVKGKVMVFYDIAIYHY